MAKVEYPITEQFQTHGQQHETAHLGTWAFLATELMMFGGLLVVIWYTRTAHPGGVGETVGHLHYWLAGVNSVLLLTSSLAITLAVVEARDGQALRARRLLLTAVILAGAFLLLKGYEYFAEYREQLMPWQVSPLQQTGAQLFFNLYLIATALHALHVIIALSLGLLFWARQRRGRLPLPERITLLEAFSHYWHVVDVIWILLYPSLYLVGRPA